MRNRLFITSIFLLCLFVACDKQKVDLIPGAIYSVATTEGDGFAIFEQLPNNKWTGIYYSSHDQLMAEKRKVRLKVGKELAFVDDAGKTIPILSYRRYEEPEFTEYPETWTYRDSAFSVMIDTDVVYGSAQGYWISYPDSGGTNQGIYDAKVPELKQGKKELDLTMDLYLPDDNKEASRPLLVLIHGGAFFNGDKCDLGFPAWAKAFASRGYVVASVNYRLGFKKNLTSVKRAGYRSVQDVDAAIRYIIHHKEEYDVDPNRVFVAGTSAGGITALNVAFMRDENIPSGVKDEGGIKSINPEMNESYQIRAVGNMWGAVNDLSMLDNAQSSVISFHNIDDPVVPFGKGHPFESVLLNWLLFPTMYGSEQIDQYLGSERSTLKRYNFTHKHTLHVDKDEYGVRYLNFVYWEIETAMSEFFSSVMLPSPVTVKHVDCSQRFDVSSSDIDSVFWQVEGGAILKETDHSIDVLLFPDSSCHSVLVCGIYKSGLTFRYQWIL